MKTESILPAVGWLTIGAFASIFAFALIFIPQYQREVNRVHYADEVIQECIEQYDDFFDTIGEGDAYSEYVFSKQTH